MARTRIQQQVKKPSTYKVLIAFGLLLLADAPDEDGEEEEMLAVIVLKAALQERRHTHSRKYGTRGPYVQQKCPEFFQLLLHGASDRLFKAFFR
jgi:hypothetical protein